MVLVEEMSLRGNDLGSGRKAAGKTLGEIGQGIAEMITGGCPASFPIEPGSRLRLRTDIYLHELDAVVEVKAGGSKVRDYQVAQHLKRHFAGGLTLMFVQNPFTGEIGPDLGDYLILRKRGITYSQVWFTGTNAKPIALSAKESPGEARLRMPAWPFGFGSKEKRGLKALVLYSLYGSDLNGAELIKEIQSLTHGLWRPTSGSLYPLLRDLQEQGIIQWTEDEKYRLATGVRAEFEGAFHLGVEAPAIGSMVASMHRYASYIEDVKNTGREDLRPHRARLKELAERLRNLAGEDEDKSTSEP